MKKVLFALLVVSAATYSCGSKDETKKDNKETPNKNTEVEASKDTLMGEPITADGAMSPAEFLAAFEGKDSMEVKISSTITEVCQKKGCWMTIDMGDAEDMMVRFDYKFLMPLNSAKLPVVIEGWAKRTVTSVDDQKHYLEDANASEEEIAAITEPKVEITFLAKGTILKNE